MPVRLGSSLASKLYLGSQPVSRLYLGSTLIHEGERPLMFSILGQSNVQGRAPIASLPSYMSGAIATVKIWTGSSWVSIQANVNNGYPQAAADWGPEMNLGFLASALAGKTVYIVKHAQGGTPLVTMTAPTWNPSHGSSLWIAAKTELQEALSNLRAQGLSPDVVGLWGQGEEDSKTLGQQAAYAAAQQQLFNDWRAAASAPNMPIVDMRVRSGNDGVFVARAQINAAKDTVRTNLTNVTQIQTDGFGDIGDSVHYDGVSQLAFGRLALEKGRSLTFPLPSGVPAPVVSVDVSQQAYSLGAVQRLQQADDVSGAGNHLVAIDSAARPQLLEGVLTRGFGMMGFQSGYGLATAASPIAANSPYTFASVISNWTVNAGFKALLSGYAAGVFAIGVPASSDKIGINHANRFVESSVGLTTAPQIVLVCYAAGAGTFIRINGVETASSSTVQSYSAPPRLGFNYINGNMLGQYRQSRPLVWNVALTTAQAERIEGFLAHRFYLTDVLPSGHPYKNSAPS